MSIDGVLFNKSQTDLICYPTRKSGSYIIQNEVEHIGNYAFYGCLGLLSVDIPDSVAIIGTNAFGGCDNLKKVYTNKDFRNIIIQDGNECLTEAAIHYETVPHSNDGIVMNDDVIITIYESESNIITYKLKTENPENYVDCDIYATVYNSNGGANDIGHAEFDEDGKAEISIILTKNP